MRKSQEDADIEKIFQKSRMTTEAPIAPIVKQEVDQEKPKELENNMYRSAKGWIETLCSAAETAGHISSELLTTVGTQKNQRRESEARAEREKSEAELRYAKARIENARALQEEIKADYMRDVQECYREYLKQNIAKVSGLPFVELLPPAEAGDPE